MNGSGHDHPPRLHRRRAPRRPRRQGARAGFCRAWRKRGWICAGRARQDIRISRRPRAASGIPHRVVVCDRQSRRRAWRGLWRAMDAVSSGDRGGRRRRKAGPTSRSGWAMPPSPAPIPIASAETFARGGVGQAGVDAKPFRAWIDAWEMRGLDPMNDDNIAPLRAESIGRRFQLRAAPRRRPRRWCCRATPATAANRCANRPPIITASRIITAKGILTIDDKPVDVTGHGLARSRVEQPAAGLRSKRMGLALAAFQGRRQS